MRWNGARHAKRASASLFWLIVVNQEGYFHDIVRLSLYTVLNLRNQIKTGCCFKESSSTKIITWKVSFPILPQRSYNLRILHLKEYCFSGQSWIFLSADDTILNFLDSLSNLCGRFLNFTYVSRILIKYMIIILTKENCTHNFRSNQAERVVISMTPSYTWGPFSAGIYIVQIRSKKFSFLTISRSRVLNNEQIKFTGIVCYKQCISCYGCSTSLFQWTYSCNHSLWGSSLSSAMH